MKGPPRDTSLFISRELSWLAFNERVLEEAIDTTVPLLERVKFAAIVVSNLDEFFMVRVAGLKRAVDNEETAPDPSGLTPVQQLAKVGERVRLLTATLGKLVNEELRPALEKHGIRLLSWPSLTATQASALSSYFSESVMPILTPLAIDVSRPFPLLTSLSLNLAVVLDGESAEAPPRLAIVQVPSGLNRLVRVPGADDFAFVLLEDIIRAHLTQLFSGQQVREIATIRLSRDSELELDDEGERPHIEHVERELRRRRRSDVVRLETGDGPSGELIALLQDQLDIDSDDIYTVVGALDLRVLFGLVDLPGFDTLRDPPVELVNVLAEDDRSIFSILDERDVLLHHPYDSFDPVLTFLAEAAGDPDVLAIKQTLYRVSAGSPLIASLQRAAEANKQVTVLVELTARFDEERNIRWARELEAAGAHVIYGVRGYKTHAKMCLIVRRTAQGLRRYVHLGTGNYNERTARQYTDFGLMTSSRELCEDASAVFNAISGYSDPPRLKKATMAPTGMRGRFLKLIDRERRRAESGQPAEIVAKMNSLVDVEIIEALYAASRSGVKIRLNVRGVCTLRPCVPGTSENIEVVSIVDRFLEHSRIYFFLNGGDEDVYLASADWMPRNLDRRIELMFPVEDPAAKKTVIFALRAMFGDTVKSRWLGADGVYRRRRRRAGETPCRVQMLLQEQAKRAASAARNRAEVTFQPLGTAGERSKRA